MLFKIATFFGNKTYIAKEWLIPLNLLKGPLRSKNENGKPCIILHLKYTQYQGLSRKPLGTKSFAATAKQTSAHEH